MARTPPPVALALNQFPTSTDSVCRGSVFDGGRGLGIIELYVSYIHGAIKNVCYIHMHEGD